MSQIKKCLLCFNETFEEITPSCSTITKCSELLCKYLHSSFTQETVLSQSTHVDLSFCSKCFESTVELVSLDSQMEFYQKRISELVFILSLEILHRRVKSADRDSKNNSEKKLIEFDVTSLPNYGRWNNNSFPNSISETCVSATQTIPLISTNVLQEELEDPFPIPELPENVINIEDIVIEEIKCGISEEDFSHENFDPEENGCPGSEENEVNIKVNSTAQFGNKTLPTLKLQRLPFNDGERKFVVIESKEDSDDSGHAENRKVKFQTIRTKCDGKVSCYKITAINNKPSRQIGADELDSPQDFPISTSVATVNKISAAKSSVNFDKKDSNLNSSGENAFKCHVCNKIFSTESILMVHTKMHRGERSFKCDVCRKSFSTKKHLLTHKRSHTGEQPYNCDVCEKSFPWKQNLLIHKRCHTGERPYSCDVCEKSFSSKQYLLIHKRSHKGEQPYNCDVCGKGFTWKQHLLIHKRCHTGERPYSCDVCKKAFSTKHYLSIHKRCHTGEKCLKCDQCDYSTNDNSNLKKHKINTHCSLNRYKCRECKKDFKASDFVKKHYKRVHFALDFSDDCVIKNIASSMVSGTTSTSKDEGCGVPLRV